MASVFAGDGGKGLRMAPDRLREHHGDTRVSDWTKWNYELPTVAWMPASWFRCRLCGEEPTSTWGPRNGCPHEWMMVGGPTLQEALVEAGQGTLL